MLFLLFYKAFNYSVSKTVVQQLLQLLFWCIIRKYLQTLLPGSQYTVMEITLGQCHDRLYF